jgi:hypothetical protein
VNGLLQAEDAPSIADLTSTAADARSRPSIEGRAQKRHAARWAESGDSRDGSSTPFLRWRAADPASGRSNRHGLATSSRLTHPVLYALVSTCSIINPKGNIEQGE